MDHPPPSGLRVGTSSWSSGDWRGRFYPEKARPETFLEHYAARFDTVECDATFYRIPSPAMVRNWDRRTPSGFLFSAKLPREITHDRRLEDCKDLVREFTGVMGGLGEKLGPLVAQFPYVAKGRDPEEYATGDRFRERLRRFLDGWPRELVLAVEVRNARWLASPLLDLLKERKVPLVLPAYYTMPGPEKMFAEADADLITGDRVYVRFLGDHKRMDRLVAKLRAEGKRRADWSEPAENRDEEMRRWARVLRKQAGTDRTVLAYFNNHYAGFGPGSAERFLEIWREEA